MAKLFDDRLKNESAGLRVIRRLIIAAAVIHFSLAALSGYRAWVQVYSLGISTQSDTVGPGSILTVNVTSSGRNPVTVTLEAVQGGIVSVLAVDTVADNRNRFYDPRPRHGRFQATLDAKLLTNFGAGPLILRARGEGRSQFLRVPPPKIESMTVTLSSAPVETVASADEEGAADDTMCIAARIGLPCR